MSENNTSKKHVADIFHENVLATLTSDIDVIKPDEVTGLYSLFKQRVKRTPDATAYIESISEQEEWHKYSWQDVDVIVDKWRHRLLSYQLSEGDRVAVLMRNSVNWVVFDMACQSQGVVNVPLYVGDRADNMAYIINETSCRLLLIESADHWVELRANKTISTQSIEQIIVTEPFDTCSDDRVVYVEDWLAQTDQNRVLEPTCHIERMEQTATIVYTSGTTGRPKGVMLSHKNIISNAFASAQKVAVKTTTKLLSFLPLSHTFERTLGYYCPMMCGGCVQYTRSIQKLNEDLLSAKPTMMIAVPRIFERINNKIVNQLDDGPWLKKQLFTLAVNVGWYKFLYKQSRASYSLKLLLWPLLDKLVASKVRDKLGGRLEFVICGGAPLPFNVAKLFIGLGVNLIQGYGLTETAPVLSGNKVADNYPDSIGLPLIGVQLKLGDNDELLAKGPNIMQGYWNNDEATKASFTEDGWLKTGDIARISETGHLYIVGRVKEILVLSNGEKVPPADIETAIMEDSLFIQSMVIGEGRSFLSLIAVVDEKQLAKFASANNLTFSDDASLNTEQVHALIVERIKPLLRDFPGYAQVYKVYLSQEQWTNENDLITPTLKLKRPMLLIKYKQEIAHIYDGH